MWPCAVSIQPACDSRRQLEFVNFHPSTSTSNAQRPTSNVEMVIADLGSASASLAGDGASPSQNSCDHVHTIAGLPLRVSARGPKRASEALALPGKSRSLDVISR